MITQPLDHSPFFTLTLPLPLPPIYNKIPQLSPYQMTLVRFNNIHN